ncbi:Nuclear transport factor Nxt2 [Schizosaccharomyces pombe]|uniref:Nuclear transport factor 2 n=1 Tax=Schizosaccharomyces pombe (strain 972 / ATCC 24843) TaxID=284812 RepID=NTF2_SCHPO|nr:nuclear transport factor Nxt2 [Schizosaccharomyces pombe]Q10100.2 RecName: Full=Nuclear transport factor 2; Short=NTF-2 [Schizosaccharomyces pombe 972h-]CAA92380.3 nuclear transport factor Nxt2 [Schizosaccharomyces pombe]|eukprot:NP_001342808.1 nuclear transport factor Nxt2 [Schizosaccharomyces pombe]
MADYNALATQFTQFYYQTFDSDRSQLSSLYREESMLSFEGAQLQGTKAIVEKLVSLPFQRVQHRISTLDAQPTGTTGSVIVMVTGELLLDEEQMAQRYSQVFHLVNNNGNYYVLNDLFRLNYG